MAALGGMTHIRYLGERNGAANSGVPQRFEGESLWNTALPKSQSYCVPEASMSKF